MSAQETCQFQGAREAPSSLLQDGRGKVEEAFSVTPRLQFSNGYMRRGKGRAGAKQVFEPRHFASQDLAVTGRRSISPSAASTQSTTSSERGYGSGSRKATCAPPSMLATPTRASSGDLQELLLIDAGAAPESPSGCERPPTSVDWALPSESKGAGHEAGGPPDVSDSDLLWLKARLAACVSRGSGGAPGPPRVEPVAGVSELLDLRSRLASRLAELSSAGTDERPEEPRCLPPPPPGLRLSSDSATFAAGGGGNSPKVGSLHHVGGLLQGSSAATQAPYVAVLSGGFAYMVPS
mmetsp:Transcript_52754/g.133979  ORF Transcript_52754/g.133979 Transcript_52754/m.133979 type:complete len:294 (+) Transcript_52754:35-916(+)